jgi:ABC-type dipeptide/oligopeptide/nickel transport system permease subunit
MSITEAESTLTAEQVEPAAGGIGRDALRRLLRNPAAIIGALLVVSFVGVAIAAPWLAPHGPNDQRLVEIVAGKIPGPSAEFPLGVDDLGRDELSRIMYGARYSLIIGVVSTLIGMFFGILLGVLSGTFGFWADSLVMRFVDMMLSVPGLLIAIGIAAMLGQSLTSVMIAIGVVSVPIFARLLRSQMLAQRESDYVLAARSIGLPRLRIIFTHVLPNSLTPVIVQGTLTLATAIIEAAGLAFLGLSGTDPATPEWGRMLADTQRYLSAAPQLVIFPGLAIVISALGFTLLGESLREALDPKYRR